MDSQAVVIVLTSIGVLFAIFWLRRPPSPETLLRRACRGDAAQASRLIEHELRRIPTLSRPAAAARALDALRYENR